VDSSWKAPRLRGIKAPLVSWPPGSRAHRLQGSEEQIAARMRQVALAGTRPNQQQADLRPESGPRSKGLSAEIVAKKIGKSKNDVKAIRAE